MQHFHTCPLVSVPLARALALPIRAHGAVLLVHVALRPVFAVLLLVPIAHSPELDVVGPTDFQELWFCRSSCTNVFASRQSCIRCSNVDILEKLQGARRKRYQMSTIQARLSPIQMTHRNARSFYDRRAIMRPLCNPVKHSVPSQKVVTQHT